MGRAEWGRIGRDSEGEMGGAGYVAVERSGKYLGGVGLLGWKGVFWWVKMGADGWVEINGWEGRALVCGVIAEVGCIDWDR